MRINSRRYYLPAAVVLLVALAHARSLTLGFNIFWDQYYVFSNPFQADLSPALIFRAATAFLEGNYHPLTLIVHSLDYTIWGLRPFGHHLASYLLHLASTLLLWSLLQRLLAGRLSAARAGRIAALTALFFGVHPLRVESVAWITERKDLLFCFFYLLALLAYLRFRETKRGRWYLFSLLFFLASSLSKAMSVTLPLVLMIGDYFLGFRRERARGGGLVIYLPFILISLGIAGLAILGQSRSGLMVPLAAGSVFSRLIQFPEAALFYLRQTLWPFRLVPFYPNELLNSVTGIAVSWTIFLGMGAAAGRFRDNHPGLMPALLIYLVLLLPTGGLVRVGSQILADRFSLLPTIPLLALAAGWLVGAPEYPFGRKCRSAAVGGMVFCLGVLTFHYTGFWDDPISLTERAYRRYPSSPRVRRFMADSYNNAALEKVKKGEMEEAIRCCRAGLKIYPESAPLHHNLGMIYRQTGETDHSREEFDRAIFYKRKIRARRERRLIP